MISKTAVPVYLAKRRSTDDFFNLSKAFRIPWATLSSTFTGISLAYKTSRGTRLASFLVSPRVFFLLILTIQVPVYGCEIGKLSEQIIHQILVGCNFEDHIYSYTVMYINILARIRYSLVQFRLL